MLQFTRTRQKSKDDKLKYAETLRNARYINAYESISEKIRLSFYMIRDRLK